MTQVLDYKNYVRLKNCGKEEWKTRNKIILIVN